jgi:hypothetical protein
MKTSLPATSTTTTTDNAYPTALVTAATTSTPESAPPTAALAQIGRTPTTPARTSFERAVRAEVEVEIIRDPDTNTLDLIISTAIRQYELCTSEDARAEAADLRDKADSMDKLADQWDAIQALTAFLAEHDAIALEVPADDPMPDGIDTWYAKVNGKHTLMFATGMDPAARLRHARAAFAQAGE